MESNSDWMAEQRQRARSRLYLTALRLMYWLRRKLVDRAIFLLKLSLALIDSELRLLKSDFRQLGDDDGQDKIIECVSDLPPVGVPIDQRKSGLKVS